MRVREAEVTVRGLSYEEMANFFGYLKPVKKIAFIHSYFSVKGIARLCLNLKDSNIDQLGFNYNRLNSESAKKLVLFLKRCQSLLFII